MTLLHLKNLLKSPFGIAAIAGVLDLTGGLIGTLTDLWWIIFDTVIKNPSELTNHTIAYGSIITGLSIAAIHLGLGIVFTVLCYKKYKENGLESHERKLVIKYKKEISNHKKYNEVLKIK